MAEKKVRGRKDSFLQYSGEKFQESATFEGLSAYMERYQEIFEITIAFPDGGGTGRSYRVPLTQRGGELTLAWLEGRSSGPEPEEKGKTLPEMPGMPTLLRLYFS